MAKKNGRIKTTLRLPKEINRKLRIWCVEHDRSVNEIVTEAIKKFLKAEGVKEVE